MPGKKWMAMGLIVAATGLSGAASAQNSPRFQMERAPGGFMIMDTQTGNTSFCRERDGGFTCNAAGDAQAEENSIEILRKKITELEARVAALETKQQSAMNLPTESEFEQTLNFMERFFRSFINIVKGLEDEEQPAQKPAPNLQQTPPATGRL